MPRTHVLPRAFATRLRKPRGAETGAMERSVITARERGGACCRRPFFALPRYEGQAAGGRGVSRGAGFASRSFAAIPRVASLRLG